MKMTSKNKFFVFLSSLFLVGGVMVGTKAIPEKEEVVSYALVESSFQQVNIYNNNIYLENVKRYRTMLDYDVAFDTVDRAAENLATAEFDVGNKMTYNGVAVKDIPNFFAGFHLGKNGGKMIMFEVPEGKMEPSKGFKYSTLFIPKGMEVYNGVTKEDVTLYLINDEWNPVIGSDIAVLTTMPTDTSTYPMTNGYSLLTAEEAGYTEGTGTVLKIHDQVTVVGTTLDFHHKNIDVGSIKSISYKVKFEFTTPITGSEFRVTNTAGKDWLFRYSIDGAVSDTWYTIIVNADKTVTSDIPNGKIIESVAAFSRYGSRLEHYNVGMRIKPDGTARIGMYIADVIVDAIERETSSFIGVNIFNNNNYLSAEHKYNTMLEFDRKFSKTDKSSINIATSSYDIGNKMTINGVAIKDIPGFYLAYYYASDVETPMLWFKLPEEYIEPTGEYEYTTLYIPAGPVVYDLKVDQDVTLSIINGRWTKTLIPSAFKGVNVYNNNNYDAKSELYISMLEYSYPFADTNKVNDNLAKASEDIGNKMTLNGVPVKDVPDFFVSYYESSSAGPMLYFKVTPAALEPSNGYKTTTLFVPKGTIIYDCITSNDALLYLADGKWINSTDWSADEPEQLDEYDYSFAVVGDPQIVNDFNPDKFGKIYSWIADNKEDKKIAHVIGLGDITNKNAQVEWDRARESFDKLEEVGLTHTQVRGNHDMSVEFNNFFQADEYYKQDVIGYYKTMTNCYRTLRAGKNNYLILALDYGPDDDVLAWANNVVEEYSNYTVIVVTHAYLERDGSLLSSGGSIPPVGTGGYNNGDDIWNKFVRKHANISIVLSGHIYCDGIVSSTLTGDKGNTVTQFLIDPQQLDKSTPSGLVAMFYFSNEGKNLQVQYYSTILNLYDLKTTQTKFTIENKATEHSIEEETAMEEAAIVDALIDEIGTVTLNSEDAIYDARAAYDSLSELAKSYVTKLAVLEAAEVTYDTLKAADEQATIDAAIIDTLI